MKLQLQIGIPSSSSIGNINISDLPACDLASAQHVKVIRKNVDARCSIKLFTRYIYILCALTVCKSKSFRKWELNIYIVWEAVWVNPHSAQFDFCSQSAFISKSDFAIWLGLVAELGRGNINNKQPVKTFYLEIEKLLSGSGMEAAAAQHDTGPTMARRGCRPRPISIFACGTAATTGGPHTAAELGPFLYLYDTQDTSIPI